MLPNHNKETSDDSKKEITKSKKVVREKLIRQNPKAENWVTRDDVLVRRGLLRLRCTPLWQNRADGFTFIGQTTRR